MATLGEDGTIDAATQLTAFDSSDLGTEPALVLEGDTLQSIAQRVYGNGNLWYVLAAANAVTDADLVAGTTLKAPAVKTTANDANTFKPYDASKIEGPTTPSLPYISAPSQHGCNMLATVIRIFVAVVVTYVSMNPAVGAAVAGLGETAAQTVEIEDGDRQGYDWGQVGVSALTAAFAGSKAGQSFGAWAAENGAAGRFVQGAAMAAASDVANYAVHKALGEDAHFSLRGMVSDSLAAGIGASVLGPAPTVNGVPAGTASAGAFNWTQVARAAVTSVLRQGISYGVHQAIEGHATWNNGQVLGNAVTDAAVVVASMSVEVQRQRDAQARQMHDAAWADGNPFNGGVAASDSVADASFLDRYPYATASLQDGNGDVRRSTAIDVAASNALLGYRNGYPVRQSDGGLMWENGDVTYPLPPDPVITTEALPADDSSHSQYVFTENGFYDPRYVDRGPELAYGLGNAWNAMAGQVNAAADGFADWFGGTALGQSWYGQQVLAQRTRVPEWSTEGIERALLPNVMAMGERGVEGTWGDYGIGLAKGVGNLVIDIAQLGANASPYGGYRRLMGDPIQLSHYDLADTELSGAATIDLASWLVPEAGLVSREALVGGRAAAADRGAAAMYAEALGPVANGESVWHTTAASKPGAARSILDNGIDPDFLNPDSRFGAAFYVSTKPETTLAELAHHGEAPLTGIRFSVNQDAMNVLDLTDPAIARTWSYGGGPISSSTQAIGAEARLQGFNAIKFYSERSTGGINYAILDSYNEILKPVMVMPAKP